VPDVAVGGEDQVTSTSKDHSAHETSGDIWQILEDNLRKQLNAARIRVEDGINSRDNKLATLLLKKNY
jgi:hypothetical protein